MIFDIKDEVIARVALGLNGQKHVFSFGGTTREGMVLVDVTREGDGLRFYARENNNFKGDITLSLDEIFNNVPRLSRLLERLEQGLLA